MMKTALKRNETNRYRQGRVEEMLQEKLTAQQQKIFNFIRQTIRTQGFGPSIRDIAEKMRFKSPNGVVCHLVALEKKGLIHRTAKHSRSIVLTDQANEEVHGLPLVGRIAAGALMEAIENVDYIDVGKLWKRKDSFLLQVTGDSMIDAAIFDGDYVVVEKRQTATAGDIVVACTSDGEATLKHWYPEKNRVRLQPANRKMKPIFVRNVRINGVVVGVIRVMKKG
jgi:repressor LexA